MTGDKVNPAREHAAPLLLDVVRLNAVDLRRLDLETVLRSKDADEAPNGVGLPLEGLHQFGQASAACARQHLYGLIPHRISGFRLRSLGLFPPRRARLAGRLGFPRP